MPAIPASSIQTSRPVYDSRGLVTRYDRVNSGAADYPVIDVATGKPVSLLTGKPWTGAPSGQPNAPATNPNDTNRYQAVEVVKSPAVAAATGNLMDAFKRGVETTNSGFADFFNEARMAQGMNRDAFMREQRSFDTGPLAGELRARDAAFADASRAIGSRYSQSDADYQAAQRALTQRAIDTLPEYESAAQRIADLQYAKAAGAVSRYKAGSGTPRSLGGSEIAMLNRAAADVYAPFEREKIARRLGLITDLQMPLEREYANRDVARMTQYDYPNERYLYERGSETAKQIKQLQMATAGMSRAQAESYLRSLGLPYQIQQEILARHIANLGGLAQLEDQSRYRGLQDTVGVVPATPQYFSAGLPQYPVSQPRQLRGGGYEDYAPMSRYAPAVSPKSNSGTSRSLIDQAYFKQTGVWPNEDPNFSQAAYDRIKGLFASASQRPSRYDPNGGSGYVISGGEFVPLGDWENYKGLDWSEIPDWNRTPDQRAYYNAYQSSFE